MSMAYALLQVRGLVTLQVHRLLAHHRLYDSRAVKKALPVFYDSRHALPFPFLQTMPVLVLIRKKVTRGCSLPSYVSRGIELVVHGERLILQKDH